VVEQQGRLLLVAPVGPVCQPWKRLASGLHEGSSVHLIEGIAEVDLQ